MKELEQNSKTRRQALKMFALGSAGVLSLFDSPKVRAANYETPLMQKG
ncbi:MAG: hypothetical protein WDN26_18945 [Chitinophagaceae bacterium]